MSAVYHQPAPPYAGSGYPGPYAVGYSENEGGSMAAAAAATTGHIAGQVPHHMVPMEPMEIGYSAHSAHSSSASLNDYKIQHMASQQYIPPPNPSLMGARSHGMITAPISSTYASQVHPQQPQPVSSHQSQIKTVQSQVTQQYQQHPSIPPHKPALSLSTSSQHLHHHLHHHHQQQQQQQQVVGSHDRPQPMQPQLVHQSSQQSLSQHDRRASQATFAPVDASHVKPTSNEAPKKTGLEKHSMTIPACISPDGSSLADFVAQMTCFMIQEPWVIIQDACNYTPNSPLPRQKLLPEALAKPGLLKWTHNILSTTQVTQNVILLALLLIYRLKRGNPSLKGHYGSAYRLLTVALMLGNKFLDDNTYTNKTWAEVSLISVTEIHDMEVEFLSSLKYSLFVREQQWSAWLKNMCNMKAYYDEAARRISSPDPATLAVASQSCIPQPAIHPHSSHSPSRLSTTYNANQGLSPGYHDQSPSLTVSNRKRHYTDDQPGSDPRKRRMSAQASSISPVNMANGSYASQYPAAVSSSQQQTQNSQRDPRRIALPNLTVNTSTTIPPPIQPQSTTTYLPVTSNPTPHSSFGPLASRPALQPTLPMPMGSGSRGTMQPTMPTGYPNATAPQLPQATTPTFLPPANLGNMPMAGYVTPTKRQSPGTMGRFGVSPHGHGHVQGDGYMSSFSNLSMPRSPLSPSVHTSGGALRTGHPATTPLEGIGISRSPFNLSPGYLGDRGSPYRGGGREGMHMLMYLPGGVGLEGYHLTGQPVTPGSMQYHKVGRPGEVRSGVLPDFRGY